MNTELKDTTNVSAQPVIRGLIIPEQWDKEGRVVAITIQTNREEVYFVKHNKTGRELLSFVHQEIEANGKITKSLNGTASVTVKSFRPIETEAARDSAGSKQGGKK